MAHKIIVLDHASSMTLNFRKDNERTLSKLSTIIAEFSFPFLLRLFVSSFFFLAAFNNHCFEKSGNVYKIFRHQETAYK